MVVYAVAAGRRDDAANTSANWPPARGCPGNPPRLRPWRPRRPDEAFAALDRSLAAQDADLMFMRVEPMLDPLRPDPRFDAFVRKAGL